MGKGENIGFIIREESLPPEKAKEFIRFEIHIARQSEKKQGDIFFPAEELKDLIAKKLIPFGHTGWRTLHIDKDHKLLEGRSMWLFDKLEMPLKQMGFGSMINAAVTAKLIKKFPGYKITTSLLVTDDLPKYLEKLKLRPHTAYSLEEYYKKHQEYLRNRFKHKKTQRSHNPRPKI
jgi:hypothetical protein